MSVYSLCNKFQFICYTLSNFDTANPAANPMVNRYVFSIDEYTDMVLMYGEARQNAVAAVRLNEDRFPNRHLPDIAM